MFTKNYIIIKAQYLNRFNSEWKSDILLNLITLANGNLFTGVGDDTYPMSAMYTISNIRASGAGQMYATGIFIDVGTSDIEATSDDYALKSPSLELTASNHTAVLPNNGIDGIIINRTFSNKTDSDITIKEVGLYQNIPYYRRTGTDSIALLAREVLSNPITLKPNQSRQFTFSIK
mgnify:CR=1 FL=1